MEHERALAEATQGKLRSLAAIEEATRTAETLLMVAEQRRVDLMSESEAAAERKAAEVTAAARQQAQEMLERAEAEATQRDEEGTEKKKTGTASRSDSFWTTFTKTVIRTVVPAATRMLEQEIRRGTLGGIRRGR